MLQFVKPPSYPTSFCINVFFFFPSSKSAFMEWFNALCIMMDDLACVMFSLTFISLSHFTELRSGRCPPLSYMVFRTGWIMKEPKKLANIWRFHVKSLGFLRYYHYHFLHFPKQCSHFNIIWTNNLHLLVAGWALCVHWQPKWFSFSCVLCLSKVS